MESGLSLSAVGPIAVAARVALRAGQRNLTVVAKATCEIVPEAPLELCEPRPIVVGERAGDAGASIVHPGDVALVLPRAQILVLGAAYTEGGIPQTMDTVRVVVSRGSTTLVDKRLSVVGDRRGPARVVAPAGPELVEEATPFLRIPLVYERAFGGADFSPNPVGTGIAADRDGRAFLPNVYHPPGRATAEAPGFGPISARWPARAALLGGTPPSAADVDVVARLGGDLDDAYFLSAPADQQLDRWEGGETIGLYHLHPSWPWLYFDVPRWGVAAVLTGRAGGRAVVAMPLDTIVVTPEDLSVELTYRGTLELERDTLRGARLDVALVEAAGPPTSEADPSALRAAPPRREETQKLELPPGLRDDAAAPSARTGGAGSRRRGGTMVLESAPPAPDSAPDAPAPRRASRTHSGTMILEGAAAAPPSGPPPASDRHRFLIEDEATQVWADDGVGSTARELTAALDVRALRAAALPFDDEVHEEPRARAVTMSIEGRDDAPPSMPFARRARAGSSSQRPAAPIPGAPWSPGDGPRPKPADGIEQTDGDVTQCEEAASGPEVAAVASAPPEPPVAPTTAPDPAPAATVTPKRDATSPDASRDVWRVDPPEPAPPPPPPPAPARRPNFKVGLYKNVKK